MTCEGFSRPDGLGEAALGARLLRFDHRDDRLEDPAQGLVEPPPDLGSEPEGQGAPGLPLQVQNGLEAHAAQPINQARVQTQTNQGQ